MERSRGKKKRNLNDFQVSFAQSKCEGGYLLCMLCFYTSPNQCTNCVERNVTTMAITVGIANDKNVHFALFVSLYMLTSVVPHGK